MDWLFIAVALVVTAALSIEFYYLKCITKEGALAAFIVGAIVAVMGSINDFFLMTIFTVTGFVATFVGIRRKKEAGLQEGREGERGWKNVAGVGFPPCLMVMANYFLDLDPELFAILFISTITVAGADTIASEIGVRDKRAYLITTMKPCEPGTNGGVSRLGTAVSTVAALLIAVLGWYVIRVDIDILLLIPFIAGVLGNLLDSVFGVLLEDRGYMSKYSNNASTAIISALFAGMAWFVVS